MMTSKIGCFVALALAVAVVLEGCAIGVAVLPPPAPPGPLSAAEKTAAALNKLYMGWDETDVASPLGVTLSMAADPSDFMKNMYCAPELNTKCWLGFADCRLSATLYNHKIVLKTDKPNRIEMGLGRAVGYVFNQTKVETTMGKCAYMFDGDTQTRFNSGCGEGTGGYSFTCEGQTAFSGICPSTGKICTSDDLEVKSVMCKPYGPVDVPNKGADGQCFFGMPALSFPQPPMVNHLRAMAVARHARQVASGPKDPSISQWNEVIIDEHLLIPAIRFDAASVISAFVYVKSNAAAKGMAEGMRDKFCTKYNVEQIPVIGVDDTVDFTTTGGPFTVEQEETPLVSIV